MKHAILCLVLLTAAMFAPRQASAYIEAPYPLGRIIAESTNIILVRVESVDKEKHLIVYRKIKDLKGTHPSDTIKHSIGRGAYDPREWQFVMAWAEVGQTALFFHNGGAGETCINNYWYQVYAGGEWWNFSHGEPFLLRSYCGKPAKLLTQVPAIIAGQEVVVPCMVDGDRAALQLRTAKIQRLKASMKIQDYNPVRDFAGWGVEEFRPIADMPGFTHQNTLAKVSPEAGGIAVCPETANKGAVSEGAANGNADSDPSSDKADNIPADGFLCLYGAGRCAVLQTAGGSLTETPLPVDGPVLSADWADFKGDGRQDLLLATPAGLRLLMNTPKGFFDSTAALPASAQSTCPFVTAAAWIYTNGRGPASRPDILVADGFRGLRLYRNRYSDRPAGPDRLAGKNGPPVLGPWFYAGPFDNTNGAGFDKAYPPETEPFDPKKEYPGKAGEKVIWRDGNSKFQDGQINNLRLFKDNNPAFNENAVVYLYRQITCSQAVEVPASFGHDDTITVWLNGKKLLAENVYAGCSPDQNQAVLPLQAGKNGLLIKICQGGGDWAFYFQAKIAQGPPVEPNMFEDISDQAGLGEHGAAGTLHGDRLIVANVKGDGRPDVLFSAATGVLLLNTPGGFVPAGDCGIRYQAGKVTPVFGDFFGDHRLGLFVPQAGGGKLFRGNGQGHFIDVTSKAGDLAKPVNPGQPTCAACADFGGTGRQDLVIGCLNGPNRLFRNNGDGTFTDATEVVGLDRRIFNTRGVGLVDINKDGVLDAVFVNDGQESAALLTNPIRK